MEFSEGILSTVNPGARVAAMMSGHFAYYRYEPVALEDAPRHPYRNLPGQAWGVAHPYRDELPDDLDDDLGDDLIAVVHTSTGLAIAMGLRSVILARSIIETAMGWPGIDWSRRDLDYYMQAEAPAWKPLAQEIRNMVAGASTPTAGAA